MDNDCNMDTEPDLHTWYSLSLHLRINGRPAQVSLLSQLRFQRNVVKDHMAMIQYKSYIDKIYGPFIWRESSFWLGEKMFRHLFLW